MTPRAPLDRVSTNALNTSRDGGAQPRLLYFGSGLFTDANAVVLNRTDVEGVRTEVSSDSVHQPHRTPDG
jgi:hypothetical protein